MKQHDLAVATRLKEFRKKFVDNNLNVAAPILGTSRAKLNRIESGENAIDVKIIAALKKKYGLNQAWLFDGKGNMQVKDDSKKTGLMNSIEMGNRIDKLTAEVLILSKNLNRAWEIIERQQKEIDGLSAKIK